MAYFALDSDQIQMTGSIQQESGPAIHRFASGRSYQPKPDSLPFRFTFSESSGKPLYDYYSGDCLMSKRLVEVLHAAGVDNLMTFPAVLTEPSTGTVRDDYCVVSVVGLVAAADLHTSDSLGLGGGHVFTKLEVDADKAHGLLMFRLAESLIDVIVHERVARAIDAGQFHGLVLTPVTPG